MTRKEKNKILDDKIKSNINQYKVNRLNAEMQKSAFSSGDLNKYEFLTREDLKYKPSALDKARFEFSPLGKAFSTGLDKTTQGYQEEGVIKLLKEIRDGLRGGRNRLDDNNDDNNDKILEYQEVVYSLLEEINNKIINNKINVAHGSVFLNNLNNETSNVKSGGEYYARLIAYQNAAIEKLEKELIERKNLTKDIIDQASKTINENKKERLKYHDKYKNTFFDYIKTLKQLNDAENTYGREVGNLNNNINDERTITNELINKIQYLEDAEEESLETIDELNNKLDKLKNEKFFLKDDNKKLKKSIDLIKKNNDYLIKENNDIQDKVTKDKFKIRDMLNKSNDNMKNSMSNLYKEVKYEKNKWSAKLDKLNNDVKKLNNYIRENNDKIINTENKLGNANGEYNRLNEEFIKIKDKLYKTKNELNKAENDINKTKYINELNKIKEKFNHQNNKIIEIESELNKINKNINTLKNNIKDLKDKNASIHKYKKEIEELKKELNKNEKYFNSEENNRIEKIKEINESNKLNDRYEQEIRELKEKLNDKDDTSKIKSNDDKKKEEMYADMPYLETEEEVAERIADFHEKKGRGHVIY